MTAAQFRKIALSLPGAEEKSHFAQPDFRVENRIFADLSREGLRGTVKLTRESQASLLEARPHVFSAAPGHWGGSGWTYVELKGAGVAEVRELLKEAWGLVASRELRSSATRTAKKSRQRR